MPLVDESADGPAIAKCDHGQEACQPMLSRCQGLRPSSGLLRSPVGAWRIRDLDSPSGTEGFGKSGESSLPADVSKVWNLPTQATR